MAKERVSKERERPLFQGQVEAGKKSRAVHRVTGCGEAQRSARQLWRHEVQEETRRPSPGVRDGNRAAVDGGMNGGGVGGRGRRGSVEGTGQAGDRQRSGMREG